MKKLKYLIFPSLFILSFLVSVNYLLADMTSPSGYQIWADVISTGGIEGSASANYTLSDTLGEAIIGLSASANSSSSAGFRQMEKTQLLSLSLSANSLNLGDLAPSHTNMASHTLSLIANSATGVQVSFAGNTLNGTSGSISAIGATAASSTQGAGQFGFNVIFLSGDPIAQSQAPYNLSNSYAFDSSLPIIAAPSAISGSAVFDITYIANVSSSQAVGDYATDLTFSAVANF